jgi:hypothetical protein
MAQDFSTFQIKNLLEIDRNLLAQWLMRRYISPSVQRAKGPGTKNLFSINDLYNIRLFKQLVDTGIERDEAKFYIDVNFKNVGPGKEEYKFLLITRKLKKSGRDTGHIADMSLEKHEPRIVFQDDESWKVCLNLLGIKTWVDQRIRSANY